ALPTPERADARARARTAARLDHDDASSNGDGRRPAMVGLATEITAARPAKPQATVVTLSDIRLGAPPPDAALVVALPRFAPHSALDQAADLGLTADWPILGVIGIRRPGRLTGLFVRATPPPDIRVLDKRLIDGGPADTNPDMPAVGPGPADTATADPAPANAAAADKVPDEKARTPEGNHQEGER
ncbi:MAG: hypothetical protein ACRDPY_29300, partial [Streptosporangiaceae bacterium]